MSLQDRVHRRLKLRDLRLLLVVAESGSMAKAATRINLTQSAVSRAIAELEHTFGVRLFDRTPRGIEPTIYGQALLRGGAAVFDDLRTSVSEIEFLSGSTAGELRIGTSEATGFGLVPVLVDRLARQYPRAVFEVVQADAELLIERELRERRIDLAVTRMPTNGRDEDLEGMILYSDHLRVVAGLSSPWARRRGITLADLVSERWCLPPPGHPVTLQVAEAFRRCGLQPPRISATVASAHFVSNLVAKGFFLGVHGTMYLRLHPARDSLKVLPVELPSPLFPVNVITLKNRTLSPLAHLFIECAREVAKPWAKADKH
jgi:DNA-binding transcriptional LysR family regulator